MPSPTPGPCVEPPGQRFRSEKVKPRSPPAQQPPPGPARAPSASSFTALRCGPIINLTLHPAAGQAVDAASGGAARASWWPGAREQRASVLPEREGTSIQRPNPPALGRALRLRPRGPQASGDGAWSSPFSTATLRPEVSPMVSEEPSALWPPPGQGGPARRRDSPEPACHGRTAPRLCSAPSAHRLGVPCWETGSRRGDDGHFLRPSFRFGHSRSQQALLPPPPRETRLRGFGSLAQGHTASSRHRLCSPPGNTSRVPA